LNCLAASSISRSPVFGLFWHSQQSFVLAPRSSKNTSASESKDQACGGRGVAKRQQPSTLLVPPWEVSGFLLLARGDLAAGLRLFVVGFTRGLGGLVLRLRILMVHPTMDMGRLRPS
jgi:hypothetical protein